MRTFFEFVKATCMSNGVHIQQRNLSHAGLIQLVEKLEDRLPEDATIIKVLHRCSYKQISSIVEHEYEFIRYKILAFNKYVLDTPLYCELVGMMDERMRGSRMTLTNWLEKGSRLIKILKDNFLEKDSIVNCDEIWYRVKVEDNYKKNIWCLVNKVAKVVIYCYEEGSRDRDVLRHIFGESQLKAL